MTSKIEANIVPWVMIFGTTVEFRRDKTFTVSAFADILTNTLTLTMPCNEYSCASEKALAVQTGAFSDAHVSKLFVKLSGLDY